MISLLLMQALVAFGFPTAPFNALETEVPFVKSNYDFEAIVKLSNCSGAVVQFNGQPDTANAVVLTNGHCLSGWGFLRPGEIEHNKPVRRRMEVADSNRNFFQVTARKIMYATMTGTDMALYELRETFEDIKARGVRPFELATTRPLRGWDIEIISGYWERGYACHIDGFVHELREANWTMTDSIRYSDPGCEVIGGTSGSPIIHKTHRVVIGVNNTGNMDGRRCTMNNPCEVDEAGNVTVRPNINYGQQTYQVYDCLSPDFQVDLTLPNCTLEK